MTTPLRHRLLAALAVPVVAVLLAACTPTAESPGTDTSSSDASAGASTEAATEPLDTTVYPVPIGGEIDYQLGGSYPPGPNVSIVARDSSEYPAEAVYSICYVNAFQSQPQDAADWLDNHSELLLMDAAGEPVIDPNWPDEMMFDTSTAANRQAIAGIIGETITECKNRFFDAVEFDNLDSYTRSDGALSQQDNLDLATLLVEATHNLGMSAGQKNSVELGERGRDEAGFDFAVAEECAQFDECGAYTDVYGEYVINIEYSDALSTPFAEICADPATPASTVLRDRDLATPDSADYVYEACPLG